MTKEGRGMRLYKITKVCQRAQMPPSHGKEFNFDSKCNENVMRDLNMRMA
jgi:hypothetical protein